MLTFLGVTLVSGPLDFMYDSAAGLAMARSVARAATLLTALGLIAAAFIVSIPTALQPIGVFRKPFYTFPAYVLVLTVLTLLATLAGIGATGTLITVGGV